MEKLNVTEVEQVILDILAKTTNREVSSLSMEMALEEIDLKSMQVISVSALLEERLDYAPNFRALIGMEKISDIRDYYFR